jgi:hypothetical protein
MKNKPSNCDTKRRELLVALGLGIGAPSFGYGWGSESSLSPPSSISPSIDIVPKVTFDAVVSPGLTTNDAYLTNSITTNPVFAYHGTSSKVTQLGPTYPRSNMVSADIANSDTLSPGAIYTSFYHTGKTLDIIQYGLSDAVTLYVNDTFSGRYGGALVSGIAQGGSANSITLASGSSAISGYYNEYYARITGGTGVLNETRQISSYDGTRFIATVTSAWTTSPDSTTQYVIQEGPQPFVLDGSTGSIKFIHLKWTYTGKRKITIEQGIFAGVVSDGTIAPAPSWSSKPLLVVGDSFWEGEAAPIEIPRLIDTFALSMGWLPTNLGQGGTGFINRYQAGNRLNFQDRIAPPNESWHVSRTATGGTYTISITYLSITYTTAPIAFNATRTSIEHALNALPNVVASAGYFYVARGDFATPLIIVGHRVPGAMISFDNSKLAGGTISPLGRYLGDVAPNVPTDSTGRVLPFYLLVPGSGNDRAYTDTEVQTAAIYVAEKIVSQFPTAIAIFTGVFGDCNTATSVIGASDISRNAAILAGAAHLTMIGGQVPYIDTYANGLGGLKIIDGHGTVANPQAGTNSYLKSITAPGHPTGPGSKFLSDWLTAEVKKLMAH